MKKKGRGCTRVYAEICTWEGGVPYKIPAGSGPRDWIIQAMLQEARQNLMTTPLRATGARWRIFCLGLGPSQTGAHVSSK